MARMLKSTHMLAHEGDVDDDEQENADEKSQNE